MDMAGISSRRIPTIVLAVSMVLTSNSGAAAGDEKGQDDLDTRVEALYATPGLETEIYESGNGLSVSFLEER